MSDKKINISNTILRKSYDHLIKIYTEYLNDPEVPKYGPFIEYLAEQKILYEQELEGLKKDEKSNEL
jgi:hypothetical protein